MQIKMCLALYKHRLNLYLQHSVMIIMVWFLISKGLTHFSVLWYIHGVTSIMVHFIYHSNHFHKGLKQRVWMNRRICNNIKYYLMRHFLKFVMDRVWWRKHRYLCDKCGVRVYILKIIWIHDVWRWVKW